MARTVAIAGVVVVLGCLQPVVEPGSDAGVDSGQRCVENYAGQPGEVVCAVKGPVVCSGVACSGGEDCCHVTGRCFATSNRTACPTPAFDAGSGLVSCGSSSECSTDYFCIGADRNLCGGPGFCQPVSNCGFCSGVGSTCAVCGCNGVTYNSVQEACVAGVRATIRRGACGVVGPTGVTNCGRDEQCGAGSRCCAKSGKCYLAAESWRCEDLDGSIPDCRRNEDCPSGAGGGPAATQWCSGSGCAGEIGQCANRVASSSCSGTVEPVCGCNGLTYVNECWARAAGVRVASRTSCPDGG